MPKIYIKTDMREMPEGCGECSYKDIDLMGDEEEPACLVSYKKTENGYTHWDCDTENNTRPEWCPLAEEK